MEESRPKLRKESSLSLPARPVYSGESLIPTRHSGRRGLGDFGANMKISKIKTAGTAFDFKLFAQELRELSDRHGIKLVSIGAMSGLDAGGEGTTYLAIWACEDSPTGGE